MAEYRCENCPLRAHYDKNPKSFIGMLLGLPAALVAGLMAVVL